MAYLIITDKEHELDRHELTGPVIIGRSPECDVVVRDVLLSRRHLRIEPEADRWVAVDLGSKNGTFIEGRQIARETLGDADIVRAGRTRIIFRAGAFVPPPPEVVERRASRRPSDPIEALSGTMMGFELTDLEESSRVTGFPIPKPKPAEPRRPHPSPIEHDMKHSPREPAAPTAAPEWDLELREPVPASPLRGDTRTAPAASPLREAVPLTSHAGGHEPGGHWAPLPTPARGPRDERPQEVSTTTPKWLAFVYLLVAYLLCALVLWLLTWGG